MRRPVVQARKLRLSTNDETGTSLVIALVFITVIAVVVGAIMTLVDANLRATRAIRDQAALAAAADGAAQIAINQLRNGTFNNTGGACFGSAAGDSTLSLPSVYTQPSGEVQSARVTCDFDDPNSPDPVEGGTTGAALVTLDDVSDDTWNQNYTGSGTFKVKGDVRATIGIHLDSTTRLVAGSTDTIGAARCDPTSLTTNGWVTPRPNCSASPPSDPHYDTPSLGGLPNINSGSGIPSCAGTNRIVTFTPNRRFTGSSVLTALNNLMAADSSECNGTFYFPAGVYYFDFNGTWSIGTGSLVAGTPTTPLVDGTQPAMPNSCRSPVPDPAGGTWTPPPANEGVTFVFGNDAKLQVRDHARVEICGKSATAADQPPLAIYASGSGCSGAALPCAAVSTTTSSDPYIFAVRGAIYSPDQDMSLQVANNSNLNFRGGVVVRKFKAVTTRSGTAAALFEETPGLMLVPRIVVWLQVWVCPGTSCTSGGTQRLRAKVEIVDPSQIPSPGARQVKVLSWDVMR